MRRKTKRRTEEEEVERDRERERVKMKCIIITELSDVVSNTMLNYRILYSMNKNVQYR